MGVLIVRALIFGSISRPLILGNSHMIVLCCFLERFLIAWLRGLTLDTGINERAGFVQGN